MITLRREIHSFCKPDDAVPLESNTLTPAAVPYKGFTLQFNINFDQLPGTGNITLCEVPGAFSLVRRFAGDIPLDSSRQQYFTFPATEDITFDRSRQHYCSFPAADGSIPVFEGKVYLHDKDHPDWTEIRAGFAAALAESGEHTMVLHSDGIRLHILLDGRVMDENFIYGDIIFSAGTPINFAAEYVKNGWFHAPAISPCIDVKQEDIPDGIQYFTTGNPNSWVGDVVPFSHDGVVHLFYLFDRRHHGSKFSTGAHYYGHFSSSDLIHWTEHEFIGEIENQWETCGTGTPFYQNGKFYFAYGLHTSRFLPYEKNGGILLRDEARDNNGLVHAIPFDKLGERKPEGMTYAISDDCIHFRKSHILPHFCENPSVYTMPDGSLKMYAEGVWKADKPDGPWQLINSSFPPNGKQSTIRNTLECPSFFEWNGHYYLIVGMDGCYASATEDFTEYDDLAADGRDIYNGMLVPMVIPYKNNRRLISGWIYPFGTCFAIHELVALPNHALGIKWCPELLPPTKEERNLGDALEASVAMDFDNEPAPYAVYSANISSENGGKVAFRFMGTEGCCEFQIDLDGKWAQFETIDGQTPLNQFSAPLKTMREQVAEYADKIDIFKEMPHDVLEKCHVHSRDYRLDKLNGINGDFQLRILVKFEKKMPCTFIDVEIAGVRTMISMRERLILKSVSLMTHGGVRVNNLKRITF